MTRKRLGWAKCEACGWLNLRGRECHWCGWRENYDGLGGDEEQAKVAAMLGAREGRAVPVGKVAERLTRRLARRVWRGLKRCPGEAWLG